MNNLGSIHVLDATYMYQVSRSSGEDFLRFLPYMVGHVTRTVSTTFHSPSPWTLHMKFGNISDPVVPEEKSFESVDGQQRITKTCHPISSTEAFDSYELKTAGLRE